ncbi:hypothetical protein Hamer_G017478 [Homarus americanus]|uniref:Uncharacterized protein n=1 Tax=Homarus americanus TaxID=6706 RepID=A0A8J5MQH7_HOMAM|nr:hypothetical protein Hamer_G017478 [Homarus americanus]
MTVFPPAWWLLGEGRRG